MKKIILISCLSLLSCTKGHVVDSSREPNAGQVEQPPEELGERWTDRDEARAEIIRGIFAAKLKKDTGDNPLMKRDAHPKHHGCVKATLKINNSSLKEEWRKGLFAQDGEYQTWVRFSNGDPDHTKHDSEADVRGMAIKIMGVPYQSYLEKIGVERGNPVHDLVMMNASSFFLDTTEEYRNLMEALIKGWFGMGLFAISHPMIIANISNARITLNNPLDIDYHSATPYKLGNTSMKFKMVRCKKVPDLLPLNEVPAHNYLSKTLQNTLAKEDACFELHVRPNNDPQKNKIEVPSRPWDEFTSPLLKVGILNIQRQLNIAGRDTFCEDLAFNPWRAPEDNRPLGAVNRVRLEVYVKQSRMRHAHNGREEPRPTSF